MRNIIKRSDLGVTLGCAVLVAAAGVSATADLVSPESIADKVSIRNLREEGGSVRGEIVNHTGHRIEDVQLLVAYEWLWRNEFKPGSENPSWAVKTVVSDPLEPKEVQSFTFDSPPAAPAGVEGEFHPTVKVVGFTEYSSPGTR